MTAPGTEPRAHPERAADPHRSPLAAVLAAFAGGAVSTAEVRLRTGLDDEVVAAAVEHLIRMGRLERSVVDLGCAADSCESCPAGRHGSGCEAACLPGGPDADAAGHEMANHRRLSGLHLREPPGRDSRG